MSFKNRLYRSAICVACLLIASITGLHAEEAQQAQPAPSGMAEMTATMQKSMDPNVWAQMMSMMMNPQQSSPIATCALCHEGADVARFQKDYGPMMDAMWEPYKAMMNPHMMSSMMNPAMYMSMMYPMMGMMGPMMNPMGMMGPMMNPMGMMGPMMNPMGMMNPMAMMNPMMGMMGGFPMHGNPMAPPMPGAGQAPSPEQQKQWFDQWSEMMKNFMPGPGSSSPQQ